MKLYLDDNLASASLASHLRKAGHTVVLPADVGTSGYSDAQHLAQAATTTNVSLTGDHEDFLHLHLLVHATGGRHPGILVVRRDNDSTRDNLRSPWNGVVIQWQLGLNHRNWLANQPLRSANHR